MTHDPQSTDGNYDEEIVRERQQLLENLQLTTIGPMRTFAPTAEWAGSISVTGESTLTDDQEATYYQLARNALVLFDGKGQRRCIDGRPADEAILGPMTAGGDSGDALRLMLATHAYEGSKGMSFTESLEMISAVSQKYGYAPGGHALEQCGAYTFATYGILTIAQAPDVVAGAVSTFAGAVGHEYSDHIQADVTRAAQKLASELDQWVPSRETATELLTKRNPAACPTLHGTHKERDLFVFLRDGLTLDTNKLAVDTASQLGNEWHGFGYNWDFHVTIAKELGGSLGEYYLQSVPSQDVPVLTQLTDGSVRITAVK